MFFKMEICEIYNGSEYYHLDRFPRLGGETSKIIKIKKCFLQEKCKLYFEDGRIQVMVMGKFSEITYRPKVNKNEIHTETK